VTIQQEIERKLRERFTPVVLEVINESSMHSVPPGSETHFKVTVVSSAFEGKTLVGRHRLIYMLLDDEIRAGLHALTITSRTPAEWEKSSDVQSSPPCLGGSKVS
jgi:BolA family transcriptional regulator, general stress-responsive regulator